MQVGMGEFKDAALEKLTEAGKKFKRFIGTKGEAEERGISIDNEYIVSGYRVNHNTCCRAIKSLGTCHNETINVWSHLAGCVFFLFMFVGLVFLVVPRQFAYSQILTENFKTA
jgi:hypothetical protein